MTLATSFATIGSWLENRRRRRALETFSCGDCSHNERCGRPPSDTCVEKLAQIEQQRVTRTGVAFAAIRRHG